MDGGEKKLWIVANFKSNKTTVETLEWIKRVGLGVLTYPNLEVILAVRFSCLSEAKTVIENNNFNIKLCSQDVSRFSSGAYTGEECAEYLKEVVDFSIIGHSERRSNFNETDQIISEKIEQALSFKVTPILCVPDEKSNLFNGKATIVAYEPPSAIGLGNVADTPENAEEVALMIKDKNSEVLVLYGGSVNSDNARSFIEKPNIDGLLVGRASLDAAEFLEIIKSVS